MQVTFEAQAYIDKFTRLKDVTNGKRLPLLAQSTAEYWEKSGYTLIGTATVTIELHTEDQILASQLDALKAQLQTVRAENQQRENAILDQISKLQALTFTA
jgi:hypothetical protein